MDEVYDGDAVVVFSGGQDSTTCLFWAIKKFNKVRAINFRYGQRHELESLVAQKICLQANIGFISLDISSVVRITTNSALIESVSNLTEKNEKGLLASFVPNRNQLFLTLAHSYAQKTGSDYIVTGVCETDYSGYPDCRKEFIDSLEETTNLGSNDNISILAPLMYLDKADTFKLAKDLGCFASVINDSITCYEGNTYMNTWGRGCGECPSCKLRKKGYYEYIERYCS